MDKETQQRVERLEKTLATLIAWLQTELGRDNVLKLLAILSDVNENMDG